MNRKIGSPFAFAACAVLLLSSCDQRPLDAPEEKKELMLLTTTTTQDSGILKAITDAFEKKGYRVKTIVAGSGDVLKQGSQGEGDVVLSHSPKAEKEWMQQGHGVSRRMVMYNDFVLVGPPGDPAKVKGANPAEALKAIFAAKSPFISRGDKSGTHVRELDLWKKAGVEPKGEPWYTETGQGQGLTMEVASQRQGYALTDRGTYLAHEKKLGMAILVENAPALYNIYHVMPVSGEKFPRVNAKAGQAFADFLLSEEGQAVIAEFGKEKYGRSLFVPAAGKKEEEFLPN
jgi:tungstate transport system substrate-binding protein